MRATNWVSNYEQPILLFRLVNWGLRVVSEVLAYPTLCLMFLQDSVGWLLLSMVRQAGSLSPMDALFCVLACEAPFKKRPKPKMA